MRNFGAKLSNKHELIAKAIILTTIICMIIMNVADVYLRFKFKFTIHIIFLYIAIQWLRSIILLFAAIFMYTSYNIFIRYRLINERFR